MDAGGYTFVCVKAGDKSYWLAATPFTVQVGDEVQFEGSYLMNDFYSGSLDRTFPAIIFASRMWVTGSAESPSERSQYLPSGHPLVENALTSDQANGVVPPKTLPRLPKGYTVADIHSQKKDLAGQKVQVVGKVMKVSPNIMGKNWIHLQDGTTGPDSNDLTVTTTNNLPGLGQIVIAEGVITSNKTFETGYFLPLIMENTVFSSFIEATHSQ